MKKYNLLLIIPFAFLACKQDEFKPAENLEIGSGNEVQVTSLSSHDQIFYLDLNEDGLNDFKIFRDYYNGTGTDFSSRFVIDPLNDNSFVLSTTYEDSIYMHYDTTYSGSSPVQMNIFTTEKCEYSENYLNMRSSTYAQFLQNGHELTAADNWINSRCEIIGYSSFQLCGLDQTNPDTSIYTSCGAEYICNNATTNADFYIGLKLVTETEEKLGWVKLYLSENAGSIDYSNFVKEYAAQQ